MSKKRIAILGAGPSGLAQLRAFEAARLAGVKDLPEIVCYEKQNAIGGECHINARCMGYFSHAANVFMQQGFALAGKHDSAHAKFSAFPQPLVHDGRIEEAFFVAHKVHAAKNATVVAGSRRGYLDIQRCNGFTIKPLTDPLWMKMQLMSVYIILV